MGIEWKNGSGESTQIGYENPNRQRCLGHCGVSGNDHLQFAYKMECLGCGYVYGANGADVFQRKCPECQGGQAGIRYWREPVRAAE